MRRLIIAILVTSLLWISPLVAQETTRGPGSSGSAITNQAGSSLDNSQLQDQKKLLSDQEREEIRKAQEEELEKQDQQRPPDPPPRKAVPLPSTN